MACKVYGYLSDISGEAVESAAIVAELTIQQVYNDGVTSKIILPQSVSTTTDENGYWEIVLLDNEYMGGTAFYEFTITPSGGSAAVFGKYIPALDSDGDPITEAEFSTLTDMG